ncbi:MAG: hypothetical protein HOW73_24355 [Polyangiaceae bacterium]|nr:hypothetical protein [Polyangiaceae bacterium]
MYIQRSSKLALLIALFAAGCGSTTTDGPGGGGNGGDAEGGQGGTAEGGSAEGGTGEGGATNDFLVRGVGIREMTATTYNEEILPAPDAHAVVSLRRYEGEDASAPLVTEIDIPFTGFPVPFEIDGDPVAAFGDSDTLLLRIEIFNHAGTDATIGDLVSEHSNEIQSAGTEVEILVGGLESCDAPNAGGYCVDP